MRSTRSAIRRLTQGCSTNGQEFVSEKSERLCSHRSSDRRIRYSLPFVHCNNRPSGNLDPAICIHADNHLPFFFFTQASAKAKPSFSKVKSTSTVAANRKTAGKSGGTETRKIQASDIQLVSGRLRAIAGHPLLCLC